MLLCVFVSFWLFVCWLLCCACCAVVGALFVVWVFLIVLMCVCVFVRLTAIGLCGVFVVV